MYGRKLLLLPLLAGLSFYSMFIIFFYIYYFSGLVLMGSDRGRDINNNDNFEQLLIKYSLICIITQSCKIGAHTKKAAKCVFLVDI